MLKGYSGSFEPLSKNTVGKANVAGTRFENISNPYAEMPRVQTGWDRLLNWFGFRSGYDKAQEQYNLAGAEYNAQLEQLASEEQYNSPVEQAARMREAGLNPDLTGVSGESASEFDNQQQSPDVSVGAGISDIANTFMSALSGSMALFKDFASLKQIQGMIDAQDYDNAGKLLDVFQKTDPLFHAYGEPSDSVSGRYSSPLIQHLFGSKRNRSRFDKLRNEAVDTLLGYTTDYKSFDEFYKSAESFGETSSKPYMSGVFPGVSMWTVSHAMKPLSQAIYDMNMAQMEAIQKGAQYESKVSDRKLEDGTADVEAGAVRAGFEAETAEAGVRKQLAPLKIDQTKIYGSMLKQLNKMAQDGDLFAGLLGMLLGSKTLGAPSFGPVSQLYNGTKSVIDAFK